MSAKKAIMSARTKFAKSIGDEYYILLMLTLLIEHDPEP